jgi:hypothetical protein
VRAEANRSGGQQRALQVARARVGGMVVERRALVVKGEERLPVLRERSPAVGDALPRLVRPDVEPQREGVLGERVARPGRAEGTATELDDRRRPP